MSNINFGEGMGYNPEEFKKVGKLCGHILYETDPGVIADIEGEPSVPKDSMGSLNIVKKDGIAVAYGANPCICGVAMHKKNPYVFHSTGASLSNEQVKVIQEARGGIVGGGAERKF